MNSNPEPASDEQLCALRQARAEAHAARCDAERWRVMLGRVIEMANEGGPLLRASILSYTAQVALDAEWAVASFERRMTGEGGSRV